MKLRNLFCGRKGSAFRGKIKVGRLFKDLIRTHKTV